MPALVVHLRCVPLQYRKFLYLLKVWEKLYDEPKLEYCHLLCMDENESLKWIQTISQCQTADIRVFYKSDYFILGEEVDQFANEVRGHVSVEKNAMSLMTFPSILKTLRVIRLMEPTIWPLMDVSTTGRLLKVT